MGEMHGKHLAYLKLLWRKSFANKDSLRFLKG